MIVTSSNKKLECKGLSIFSLEFLHKKNFSYIEIIIEKCFEEIK